MDALYTKKKVEVTPSSAVEILTHYIKTAVNPPQNEIDKFIASVQFLKAKKGDFLAQPGHIFQESWFITKGFVRIYQVNDKVDFTLEFAYRNRFSFDMSSHLNNIPTLFNYQAITDLEYISMSKEFVFNFLKEHDNWEVLRRKVIENSYLANLNRLFIFQTEDLLLRYKKFMELESPEVKNLPQIYLASYLGVKPQSLSRIKAQYQKLNT